MLSQLRKHPSLLREPLVRKAYLFVAITVIVFLFISGRAIAEEPDVQAEGPHAQLPGAIEGGLSNSLNYVILRHGDSNSRPAIILIMNVGSKDEKDDELGFAHFIEHLAFGKTRNQPNGIKSGFEKLGLEAGKDANAATSFNDMFYTLAAPSNDVSDISTVLSLLREIASNLTFDVDDVNNERGIILSEMNQRNNDAAKIARQREAFEQEGFLGPSRLPIGTRASIEAATVDALRSFYSNLYVPDRATLVVVGDVDAHEIEKLIKNIFSDWKPKSSDPSAPDVGAPRKRKIEAKVLQGINGIEELHISWVSKGPEPIETSEDFREWLAGQIVIGALSERLKARTYFSDAPFTLGGAAHGGSSQPPLLFTRIVLWPRSDSVLAAVQEAASEKQRLLEYGISQTERDRQIDKLHSEFEQRANAFGRMPNEQVGLEIIGAKRLKHAYFDPLTELRRFEQAEHDVSMDDVSSAIQRLFEGSGPLIFFNSGENTDITKEKIIEAFNSGLEQGSKSKPPKELPAWPYDSEKNKKGKVVERREMNSLGAVFLQFENGLRAAIKPTEFNKNQVYVSVRFGGGLAQLSRTQQPQLWMLDSFIQGGTKQLEFSELASHFLMRNDLQFNLELGQENAFQFTAIVRPGDLKFILELMRAYFNDPSFDKVAFARHKQTSLERSRIENRDPDNYINAFLNKRFRNGDERWRIIASPDTIEQTTYKDYLRFIQRALSDGRIDVTVVGSADVEAAINDVAATFGSLSSMRENSGGFGINDVEFPTPTERVELLEIPVAFTGAKIVSAWPIPDTFSDIKETLRLGLFADVLEKRLINRFRFTEGTIYSAKAVARPSRVVPQFGLLVSSLRIPDEKACIAAEQMLNEAHKLAQNGPTNDELDMAKEKTIQGMERELESNRGWSAIIALAQRDERVIAYVENYIDWTKHATREEVMATAQKYIRDSKALTVIAVSEDGNLHGAGCSE